MHAKVKRKNKKAGPFSGRQKNLRQFLL